MATSALSVRRHSTARPRAVVLLYHSVAGRVADRARFTVARVRFLEQLALLQQLQQRGAITVTSLRSWWAGLPCQGTPVILTFDDGWSSDVDITLPLLAALHLPACFFLNTAHIGKAGYVSWHGVERLRSAGMDIESHGHDHVALTQLSAPALDRQLRTARHMLQDRVGTAVHFLAAPYGLWNRRVLDTALAAGYSAICTSRPGRAARGVPHLARNGVRAQTSARQLQRWCCGWPGTYTWPISRDLLLWTPKQILLHCPLLWRRVAPPQAGEHSVSTS